MSRPVLILLIVVIAAAIALIGCGCCACGALILAVTSTPVARAPEIPRPTAAPEPTFLPNPTSTPRPTDTPRPLPTATPRPTSTPRPTATATPTHAPALPTVAATPTPVVSYIYMEDDGQGHRRCNPDTVPAGRIVIERGVGRWSTQEEAYAAVGDTWPPIIANGRELATKHLERTEAQWHTGGPDDPSPGWGFHAKVEIWLDPGVYEITSLWLHDLKTGTLTVTAP